MGFLLEHNCLLVLSDEQVSGLNLAERESFSFIKDGQRLYPINIPFEFCDKNYQYLGKVVVEELTIKDNATILKGKIAKVFTTDEAKVFSANFISPNNL